jgi:hypothetical protein
MVVDPRQSLTAIRVGIDFYLKSGWNRIAVNPDGTASPSAPS